MVDMMDHLPHLQTVADEDVAEIRRKEATYRASWRRGGGVNAWHMVRRKIDRLQTMLSPLSAAEVQEMRDLSVVQQHVRDNVVQSHEQSVARMRELLGRAANAEDVFVAMDADQSGADGTVLAEIRDLRRYLLLLEARLLAERPIPSAHVPYYQGPTPVPAEDSNRHADRTLLPVSPVISAEQFHSMSAEAKLEYILLQNHAIRVRQINNELPRYRIHLSAEEWRRYPEWCREMYLRTDSGERPYVMRAGLRDSWGRDG